MDDSKRTDNTQTISDIIRGMQHAVNSAQEVLQDHQFRLMERFFDTTTGEPIMRYITLPDGRQINIPLITLIPQNTLVIDELDMKFAVRIASSSVKQFTEEMKDSNGKSIGETLARTSFNVFFDARKRPNAGKRKLFGKDKEEAESEDVSDTDVIEITMKFKSTEETEAASRIREILYKQIND